MRHTIKYLVAEAPEVLVVQDGMDMDVEVQVAVGQESVTNDSLVDEFVVIEQQTACNQGEKCFSICGTFFKTLEFCP